MQGQRSEVSGFGCRETYLIGAGNMSGRLGRLILALWARERFEQRSYPISVFEGDKPGCHEEDGEGFAVVQLGIVQFKPAALTAPLGRCCSAAFVHGRDHILESSDLFPTCCYPVGSLSRMAG